MKKLALITAILLTANILSAQIIHIPADYPTIQQGIFASHNGDTVLVHPGTYNENVAIQGFCITLASLYLVTQDTSYVSQTIIDGNLTGRVIKIWWVDSLHLSGFTLTGGYSEFWGGGIACGESSKVKIDNVNIIGNSAAFGGGISINQCENLVFRHIHIAGNTTEDLINGPGPGAGIYCEDSSPYFEDFTISGNTVDTNFIWPGRGGGVYCRNSNPVFENGFISNNSAGNGGAVYCEFGSSPVFRNVVFNGNLLINPNSNSYKSSVIHCEGEDNFPSLINSIITGNQQTGIPHWVSIYLISADYSTNSNVSLTNTIVYFNGENEDNPSFLYSVTANFSDIQVDQGDIWPGEGNINQDPLFQSTGEHPYQLGAGSPCIDAGTPDTTGLSLPIRDLMGNYRLWDGDMDGDTIIDMGAYEFGSLPVGVDQNKANESEFNARTYPNPVSESVTIEFELKQPSLVSIQTFNNLGVKVYDLGNINFPEGKNQVNWSTNNLPAGIYFCRLQLGNQIVTKKIIKVN